ncbi:MAG: UDP-N-acetylmuramate dehydrogenase [Candidatus Nanosyncoccus sp.]
MLKIEENVMIKDLVTMRIGGPARFVITVTKKEDIPEAYKFAKEHNLPVWILGGGANTFSKDDGFEGVIILDRIMGISQVETPEGEEEKEGVAYFKAYGGEQWDDLVTFVSERGYSGIEAMAGIPGTAGAAPVQNIGAYGQEVTQVIVSVEAYDTKLEKFVIVPASEMKMSYRKSIFNSGENVGRYFIYSMTVRVKKGQLNPPFYRSLQAYVDEHGETDFSPLNIARMVKEVRNSKLPDPEKIASAGSFFKNVYLTDEEADEAETRGIQVWRNAKEVGPDSPEKRTNLVNSGWLIEEAGLKGKVFHGMKVSDKAALILINESAKSYADLAAAREEIAKIIFEKFGFKIEQEPDEIEA